MAFPDGVVGVAAGVESTCDPVLVRDKLVTRTVLPTQTTNRTAITIPTISPTFDLRLTGAGLAKGGTPTAPKDPGLPSGGGLYGGMLLGGGGTMFDCG